MMEKINEEQKLLDIFVQLIKLENIYELIENKLCYEYLNKDELIEKGILLNNLTIKGITKYDEKNNSYILKLVKKKKHIDTNDLSDDENLDNFPQHMFSKGSIVHFSRKRKKYILGSRKEQTLSYNIKESNKRNCDDKNNTKNNINNNSIINDVVSIYVCSVHKIKKNQISLILRNSTELCKELNVSNMFMLCDKGYFDVCLVSSDISAQRQINAINIMKSNLDNESDILKILFFNKSPSQSSILKRIINIFDQYEKCESKDYNDLCDNMNDNICNNMNDNICNNMNDIICNNMNGNICNNMNDNICNNMNDNICNNMNENICNNMTDNICNNMNDNVGDYNNNYYNPCCRDKNLEKDISRKKEDVVEEEKNMNTYFKPTPLCTHNNTKVSNDVLNNYIYKCDKINWGIKNLNINQKKAVYSCLFSNDIFCIHGPPGTGKTTVLCELIYQLIQRNYKILVTGPSNVSVDNILRKCVEDLNIKNVVRIGIKSKVKKELHNYCYDEKIKECDSYKLCEDIDNEIEKLKLEINKLKNKKKSDNKIFIDKKQIYNLKWEIKNLNKTRKKKRNIFFKDLINKNNVIFSTCSSTSNYELNKFVKFSNFLFDAVCIDECCQCTEPLCYIPISLSKKNVFLFGDHKQLSPLIKYNKHKNKLNITLFERLINKHKQNISFLLNIQYRMNNLILLWSNKIFYEQKLVSHKSCKEITVDDLFSSNRVNQKENIKSKDNKDNKDNKENKENKDNKDNKENKENKDNDKKNKNKNKKNKNNNKNNYNSKKKKNASNKGTNTDNEEEMHNHTNNQANDIIQNYNYCPITWIETDGFDEFLEDIDDIDLMNMESKNVDISEKKNGNSKDLKIKEKDNVDQIKCNDNNKNNDDDIINKRSSEEERKKKKNSPKDHINNDLSEDSDDYNNNMLTKMNDEELMKMVKIDVDDILNLNNKSRSNKGEAYVIYKIIEKMIKIDNINSNNICIITPYSKQTNLLRNIFYDNIYNDQHYLSTYKNIEISTVDSFQGREKEIVVFSLVCSNYFKNIGFLKDYRRLNVAVTRAKRHLVIVGNSNTISNDDVLNQLYETVLESGKVYLVNELIDVEAVILNT
ncbi:dna2/nam7 helicase family member, putative [Plasmodium reichenowi]|uniref:Dna2/nam7 helicase family member, putative n=1 Tax=Plasmodium reichenowi TaxID=5854 RepID=A0A060RTT6_PLARE|nr:dna2/nam7 helicase family member, putative [Plasmodium reichenowi]